jgi:hypothetical protein
MDDVSLHSPVVRSSGPHGPSDMGVYSYEDEESSFTPRRIWPADLSRPQRYLARVITPRESPPPPQGRQITLSHTTLFLLAALGVAILVCSTASLVIVSMMAGVMQDSVTDTADVQDFLGAAMLALNQTRADLDKLLAALNM